MIHLTFRCGHAGDIGDSAQDAPVCRQCGETRVTHVKARAPRFRGACSGPYSETAYVDPAVVNLAPGGALKLKE